MMGERDRGIWSKGIGERKALEEVDVYRSQHTRVML